jgi:hypothetical protein
MQSSVSVILRCEPWASLEGRTTLVQPYPSLFFTAPSAACAAASLAIGTR